LNTALECLAEGVPMVAIPVTNDQPGVAARIVQTGVGAMVPLNRLSANRLREAVVRVMNDTAFRARAQRISEAIRGRNALSDAADHVELALLPHA
jgi:UDP:flavonoid glycosyltransferase YjiC (YdhE family)